METMTAIDDALRRFGDSGPVLGRAPGEGEPVLVWTSWGCYADFGGGLRPLVPREWATNGPAKVEKASRSDTIRRLLTLVGLAIVGALAVLNVVVILIGVGWRP
jgi:hypothetical protein